MLCILFCVLLYVFDSATAVSCSPTCDGVSTYCNQVGSNLSIVQQSQFVIFPLADPSTPLSSWTPLNVNCDDCFFNVNTPFVVTVLGTTTSSLVFNSNGAFQVVGRSNVTLDGFKQCIPTKSSSTVYMFFADLQLGASFNTSSTTFANVYTLTQGTTPDRNFSIY